MKFSVLASGSSGNSLYVETAKVRVLLDAGISGKQIQTRLAKAAQVDLASLDALLLTHEHVDHVRGLKQMLKQTSATVYTTQGTWAQVATEEEHAQFDRVQWVKSGIPFTIGDLQVTPFAVSHDAEEPVAYRFDVGQSSLTVLTDVGYVSDSIKSVIAGCQCYVFEANHDVEMLRAGPYPWSLKRRILGDKGHLSNHDAAVALSDIITHDAVDVYLAHLSEENNQPDLAQLTVESVLREINAGFAERVYIHRTSRIEATPLHDLP
ncbi:MAG: MBL fold metallo-hydrolase [Alicyclobacillus sp.]|nr:MBL fold metallo-hydrolase [Alicyclobacillus sp.]